MYPINTRLITAKTVANAAFNKESLNYLISFTLQKKLNY
jgi:hypothetical protein